MLLLRPPALPLPRLSPSRHVPRRRRFTRLAVASEAETTPSTASGAEELGGPVEISPFSTTNIFATGNEPTALQTTTSVLLSGAISVFLFRSIRRRARRAKEMRMRSTGAMKVKDERGNALERLRELGVAPLQSDKPPTPVQAFLGGIAAGVIAVILYKFTTTIEASLNRQTISDNFSVRQITITIRTIVNGLCYLATCVFGINSAGLILYSIQLALASMASNTKEEDQPPLPKDGDQLNNLSKSNGSSDNVEKSKDELQQVSDQGSKSSE